MFAFSTLTSIIPLSCMENVSKRSRRTFVELLMCIDMAKREKKLLQEITLSPLYNETCVNTLVNVYLALPVFTCIAGTS